MTLTEVLLASSIGLFIILAFSGVDVSRLLLTNQIHQDAGFHTEIAYAMSHMLKRLEGADRISLISSDPGNIQFRVPLGTDLDNAANYDWAQYRYESGSKQLFFYGQTEGGCSAHLLAKNVTGLTLSQPDEAPAPPGGEPSSADTNVLALSITVEDPDTQNALTFRGEVTIRAAAYTDISTGLSSTVSPPPAVCT